MTRKKRSQYMALSVVEGFVYYARNIAQLEKKSHKSFDRIVARCSNMKHALGEIDHNADNKWLWNKQDKLQAILDKYGEDGQIDVMFYFNAVQMMVSRIQDNIPNRDVQKEWGLLEGMLFTLYTHFEEIDKIEYTQTANQMGVEMTLAVME